MHIVSWTELVPHAIILKGYKGLKCLKTKLIVKLQ